MKTNKTLIIKYFSLAAACMLWLAAVQAAETAGTVVAFKGEVEATDPAGTNRVLHKNDAVNVGDTVRTGAGGYVVVEFTDGARATIRPDSALRIDRYAYGTGDDGAVMNLVKGGLRAVTGSIAQDRPESYKVKTNVATLGVRGTEFALRICEQDCGEEAMRYAAFSRGLESGGRSIVQ